MAYTPLYVIVTEGRYDMVAQKNTFAVRIKAKILEKLGGINESVEPGWYRFDVRRKGLNIEVELSPAEPLF